MDSSPDSEREGRAEEEKARDTWTAPTLPEASFLTAIARLNTRSLATATAVLYAFGFLVVNLHHVRYGPSNPGLFEGAYILAGLGLVLFSIPFVVSGFLIAGVIFGRIRRPRMPGKLWLGVLLAAVFMTGSAVMLTGGAIRAFGPYPAGAEGAWEVATTYGVVASLVSVLAYINVWLRIEDGIWSGMRLLLLPLLLIHVFSAMIYPELSPGFGGGAGWFAELSGATGGQEAVLLLRLDGSTATVLRCDHQDEARIRQEIVVIDSSQRVQVLELLSPRVFQLRCRK